MEKRETMDGELHGEARAARASFVTWIGLVVNIVLTAFKYLAGFLGHSGAMIADATHSLSDLITDVVVILGFRIVSKPADHGHDYGHGKVETLLAAICGFFLLAAGLGILWSGACYGLMGIVNPLMKEHINWYWFLLSQFVYGISMSYVVHRSEFVAVSQAPPLQMGKKKPAANPGAEQGARTTP